MNAARSLAAERGASEEPRLRVVDSTVPSTAVKADVPPLNGEMSVSQAFAVILSSTVTHFERNQQGALTGGDPEFLHQMRVALRRSRSALSAFSGALAGELRAPIAADLKWLGGVLGTARDWDVFVMETLPPLRKTFADCSAIEQLAKASARLQSQARARARRTLRSTRYEHVMSALRTWIAEQRWRQHAQADLAALDAPVRAYAPGELERRYQQVCRRGRKIEALDANELHELRIAIKKLRYSADFFAALFDPEGVRNFRARLSRLQDILGVLNDAATLPKLVDSLFEAAPGSSVAEGRGIVLGWGAGRASALKGELERLWRAFRRSETYW